MRVSFDELIDDGYLAEDALRFENPSFDMAPIIIYDIDDLYWRLDNV